MRSAAGAQVGLSELHQPHRTGQLLLAAVGQAFQVLRLRIPDLYREIRPDRFVRRALDLRKLFLRQFPAEIDSDDLASHMKPDVFIAKARVDNAGNQMLARMLLRQVKAARPVDAAEDLAARLQRRIAQMYDLSAALVYLQHPRTGDRAEVAGLSAALRIEDRPVKQDLPAAERLTARHDPRLHFAALRLCVI